tara:strand:+ start:892 stop:1632 length:741 start_codon:yes stop_codon:yes gene_type:complete
MMLNYIKSISIFLILQLGICFCADLSAVDILEKSIRRLDGVDHSLFIEATTSKKNDDPKTRELKISVHWGEDKSEYKMIYLEEGSNGSKGRELLIHEYSDASMRTWVKYPKSGKVKEIKDKKLSKRIDVSDITIPLSLLDKKIAILSDESVNDVSCKVLNIKDGDETMKLWIDTADFIIHKKEHYDKKSKLYKTIEYTNLITQDKIKFYKNAKTVHLKDKTTASLVVKEFKIEDFKDNKIFKAPKK